MCETRVKKELKHGAYAKYCKKVQKAEAVYNKAKQKASLDYDDELTAIDKLTGE